MKRAVHAGLFHRAKQAAAAAARAAFRAVNARGGTIRRGAAGLGLTPVKVPPALARTYTGAPYSRNNGGSFRSGVPVEAGPWGEVFRGVREAIDKWT